MRLRRIRRLMAVLLCCFLLLPAAQAAAEGLMLSVSYPEDCGVGESFTVEVHCQDNPGFCAAQLTLAFDRTVLDCTSCQIGPLLSGMTSTTNPAAASGAIIAAVGTSPATGDRLVARFAFTVLQEGDYGFRLLDVAFSDAELQLLPVTVTGVESAPADLGLAVPSGGETMSPAEPPAFQDIAGHWAQAEITRAAAAGLVNGYAEGLYGPDQGMTRAHFVTILWRSVGCPEPEGAPSFTDLDNTDRYYYKAVAWAEENGVVDGVAVGRFAPCDGVTREQIAAAFFRMSGGVPGGEAMYAGIYALAFADSDAVSGWARNAVWWAVYREVWCAPDGLGTGGSLCPGQPATRGEIAVMIMRYLDLEI